MCLHSSTQSVVTAQKLDTPFPAIAEKKVKAQEISQHRASRCSLGTLEQCSVKAGDGPFLRNVKSLQSKISPFFHGFLQVFYCGDPLGPSI